MIRRSFLQRLLGGAAVGAAAALSPDSVDAKLEPIPVPRDEALEGIESVVVWPCIRAACGLMNSTPKAVWPSVKFRLSCVHCGQLQPYRWHLKKFDPQPTEYSTLRTISPLVATGLMMPAGFGSPPLQTPPPPPKVYIPEDPKNYWRERYARKHRGRLPEVR